MMSAPKNTSGTKICDFSNWFPTVITDMKEKEFDENNNKTFIFAQYFPL